MISTLVILNQNAHLFLITFPCRYDHSHIAKLVAKSTCIAFPTYYYYTLNLFSSNPQTAFNFDYQKR